MSDVAETWRNENKYIISLAAFRTMYNDFSKIFHQDKHNRENGYMVRSLYFDSYSNDDYFDKVNGLENRKKIRLRIYDPDAEIVKLEAKQKSGQYQLKQTMNISRDDANSLIKGRYSVLLNYDTDFSKNLYFNMNSEGYRPKCIVEYKRIAFTVPENNIRFNFDYEIVATESNTDLFSGRLNMSPVLHTNSVVFEVKYNRFLLSYIKDRLDICDKVSSSVSKYCLARGIGLF